MDICASNFLTGYLVGGWTNPIEKYESKRESSPIFGVKTHMFETTTQLLYCNQSSPQKNTHHNWGGIFRPKIWDPKITLEDGYLQFIIPTWEAF